MKLKIAAGPSPAPGQQRLLALLGTADNGAGIQAVIRAYNVPSPT